MFPFLEAYKNLLTKSRFCCIDCMTITISCLGKKEQEEDKQNIEYRLVRSTCISSRPTRSDNNFRLKVRVQCFQVAKKIEGKCYNKLQSTSQHHMCGTKNSHIQIAISLISLYVSFLPRSFPCVKYIKLMTIIFCEVVKPSSLVLSLQR